MHNIFRVFFKIYIIIYISLVDDKAAAKIRRVNRHCAKGLLSGLSRHRVRTDENEAQRIVGLEELLEKISRRVPQIGQNKFIY